MAAPALPRYVAIPTPQAPRFGLESVVQWLPADDHVFMGVQFEPLRCDAARLTGALQCEESPDESPFGVPKETTAGVPLVLASPFAVYGEYECNPVGRPLDEAFERARLHLELGRGRAIERAVQLGEAGNEPNFVGEAVDITPGAGAVGLAEALAYLEQYLGENYGGVGVIHMDRHLALRGLSDYGLLYPDGDVLRTGLGTPVIAGGGYDTTVGPDGESPSDDTAWIYATGAIYGWQSEVGFIPDSPAGAINRDNNTLTVLAEQTFVIAWECLTAAIAVDLTSSDELLGDVNVNNFPATQAVSGTVALDAPTLAALENISAAITSLPSAQRTTGIARVSTATTTAITAGARSYSVTVVAAASAASPTLDGVAIPAGMTVRYEADGANTLEAASVVTVSGDDVIITETR